MHRVRTRNQNAGNPRLGFLACLLAVFVGAAPASAEKPEPLGTDVAALPVIAAVSITNNNIFDLEDPAENKSIFRLANRLHVRTREDVIRQQLLFKPGEPLSRQAVEETERILRGNRYIQDVNVRALPREDGLVDVDVTTSDVWTLMPKVAFKRAGGASETALGIKEMNLLGSGIAVEALYKSEIDRDSTVLKIVDRNLGQSWYRLEALLSDNSDGHDVFLNIGKPFYSLDSRNAQDLLVNHSDRIESYYVDGELAAELQHEVRGLELSLGRSGGLRNGWAKRIMAGLVYDEHLYAPLEDAVTPELPGLEGRKLVYPFVGVEFVEDRFEKSSNLDQIHRVEDRFLGTAIGARLGLSSTALGADRDTWILNGRVQKGFGETSSNALVLASELDARFQSGGAHTLALDLAARFYRRQSERRLLYVGLTGTYGRNPDPEQYLALGGDNGMRGYPLRYQTGESRAVMTIEQRIFTDWYPFRLFRVGGAAFFDVGKTWGSNPVAGERDTLLKDIGLGLRLGSTRSGLGRMIHIDVAFPLDGETDINDVQFLVSTRKSF